MSNEEIGWYVIWGLVFISVLAIIYFAITDFVKKREAKEKELEERLSKLEERQEEHKTNES